jgi:regulator of cell morphogenesis and NO signaling
MDYVKTRSQLEQSTHPYFQFDAAIERLEEEHRVLSASLLELCAIVEELDYRKNITNWVLSMSQLKLKISDFQQALEKHSKWEEDELFQLVDKYFDEIPSLFGLIEQEHQLVDQFMNAFISVVDQNILAVSPQVAAKMGTYLQLALSSLLGHFKKEQDIVASLADFSNQYGY